LPEVKWGQRAGTHIYSANNLPSHAHGLGGAILQGVPVAGDGVALTGNSLALTFARNYSTTAPTVALHAQSIAGTTDTVGSGQMTITEPFLGIYHCIALTGVFPSRN